MGVPVEAAGGDGAVRGGEGPPRDIAGTHLFYFAAGTGSLGAEVWRTDGTPEGTTFVMDVEPGSGNGVYSPQRDGAEATRGEPIA